MSSNTATDNVPTDGPPAQARQEFDSDTYKRVITSFPHSINELGTLATAYHATLSPRGHADLAARALRDLLFRARHELDMAKQLDRISDAIGPKFKIADWIPDDGAVLHIEDATLNSRVDLVLLNGSMGPQGSWLIANLLNPIRKLFATCRETFTETRRLQTSLDTAKAKLAETHIDHNIAETRWRDKEKTLRERVRKRDRKLQLAIKHLVEWGNRVCDGDARVAALWRMMRFYQRRLVSEEEYRRVVKWRARERAWRPRVIRHSQNLNQVEATTIPAGGCMVRISLQQRVAAVYGYIPSRLELAMRNGDGIGFVAELDGDEDEDESGDAVEPTSNYATVWDGSREAWLDWFD